MKKIGLFAAGVLFGTAGIKLLGSKDAKKVYAHTTAAALRAKEGVMKTVTAVREGADTTVLDNQGNQTATLVASGSNRKYVTINEIPINLQHAFVAIEDERFYDHNGIDLQGILRAGLKGVASGFHFSEGASTITQQLVKNMYYDQNKTFARKAAEAWTALYVERQLSKEEILELYINTIYFGDGYYGLKEASLGYFGKEPQELNDSEAFCFFFIKRFSLTNIFILCMP